MIPPELDQDAKGQLLVLKEVFASPHGKTLMEYLERRAGYNKPMITPEDDYNDSAGKLREGGRQLVIAIKHDLNLADQIQQP